MWAVRAVWVWVGGERPPRHTAPGTHGSARRPQHTHHTAHTAHEHGNTLIRTRLVSIVQDPGGGNTTQGTTHDLCLTRMLEMGMSMLSNLQYAERCRECASARVTSAETRVSIRDQIV